MATWTVPVTGLTCHGCVETITHDLGEADEIDTVSVNLVQGGTSHLTLTGPQELTDDEVQRKLSAAGAFFIAR